MNINELRVRVRVLTAIFGLEEIHNDRSRLWALFVNE